METTEKTDLSLNKKVSFENSSKVLAEEKSQIPTMKKSGRFSDVPNADNFGGELGKPQDMPINPSTIKSLSKTPSGISPTLNSINNEIGGERWQNVVKNDKAHSAGIWEINNQTTKNISSGRNFGILSKDTKSSVEIRNLESSIDVPDVVNIGDRTKSTRLVNEESLISSAKSSPKSLMDRFFKPIQEGFVKLVQGGYEILRGGVELISDFVVSSWEAVVGTATAIGQLIAPALPFIPAVVAAISPVGAVFAALLLSGSYLGVYFTTRPDSAAYKKGGIDFFFKSITTKLGNAWKAFGVRFSDDFGGFKQKDNKVSIFQSIMSLIGMVPILGNIVPGARAQYDKVSAIVYSRGIHGNSGIETKAKGNGLAASLQNEFRIKAENMEYEYGSFTDVALAMLNVEHSASYDEAWKFLGSGVNEQGKGYVLMGHSGGVERSAYFSKIMGSLGYGAAMLIGVAGPIGGLVPTNFGNVDQIHLLGSTKEDFVSRMADWLHGTPRDALGNKAESNFLFAGRQYAHNDLGADPKQNPYLHDIENQAGEYLQNHPEGFSQW
jgi:hypothetical protein